MFIRKKPSAVLYERAESGSLTDFKLALVQPKVDLSWQNEHGWTALHLTCAMDSFEKTALLLSNGALPSIRNRQGRGALSEALKNKSVRSALMVLERVDEADVCSQDVEGWTALHFVCSQSGCLGLLRAVYFKGPAAAALQNRKKQTPLDVLLDAARGVGEDKTRARECVVFAAAECALRQPLEEQAWEDLAVKCAQYYGRSSLSSSTETLSGPSGGDGSAKMQLVAARTSAPSPSASPALVQKGVGAKHNERHSSAVSIAEAAKNLFKEGGEGIGTVFEIIKVAVGGEGPARGPEGALATRSAIENSLAHACGNAIVKGIQPRAGPGSGGSDLSQHAASASETLRDLSQGVMIASAVIAVIVEIARMVAQVKLNRRKCEIMMSCVQSVQPALEQLTDSLTEKGVAVLTDFAGGRPWSRPDLKALEDDVRVLLLPCKRVRASVEDCAAAVKDWVGTGQKLFGALRQVLSSRGYAELLEERTRELSFAFQALQTALGVRSVLKLDTVLRLLPPERQLLQWGEQVRKEPISRQEVEEATKQDQCFKELLLESISEMRKDAIDETLLNMLESVTKSVPILSWDRLELYEEVGGSSYSRVSRARLDGDKIVAVKRLVAVEWGGRQQRQQAVNEANMLFRFEENNFVVRLFGVVADESRFGLVLEFRAPSLYSFLNACPVQPAVSEQRLMAKQIGDAMRFLHSHSVLHHDLRAQNVLFGEPGRRRCILADFGMSRIKSEESVVLAALAGLNPRWMAPEYLTGRCAFTAACDVYSFAMTLCEILSGGEAPFGREDAERVRLLVLNSQRPPVGAEKDAALTLIMIKAWEQDPAMRPTFDAITLELSQIQMVSTYSC